MLIVPTVAFLYGIEYWMALINSMIDEVLPVAAAVLHLLFKVILCAV